MSEDGIIATKSLKKKKNKLSKKFCVLCILFRLLTFFKKINASQKWSPPLPLTQLPHLALPVELVPATRYLDVG